MKKIRNHLEYYLGLPYSIEIYRDHSDENPGWVAKVKELPGCITQADSFEELEEMIYDAMRSWIEVALEDGIPVPEPRGEENFSGKFVVRLPKSLHRELVEASQEDNVSLNTFVINILAKAMGFRTKTFDRKIKNTIYGTERKPQWNQILAEKGDADT